MQTRARRWVVAVFLVLVMAACQGCGRMADDKAFSEAQAANTEQAYQTYLTEFPKGRHAGEARDRGAALAWPGVREDAPRKSLVEFASRYEGTSQAREARQQLADLDWAAAEKGPHVASYRQFAADYPNDPRRAEAQERAGNLAWLEAEAAHTEEAYRGFAAENPHHPKAGEAQKKAENCAWLDAAGKNTKESYERFLAAYPSSTRAEEARSRIEGKEVDLYQAQRQGLVRASVKGSGLDSVSVSVRRLRDVRLRVVIPAGTYFACRGSAQNMVSRRSVTVELLEQPTAQVSVSASCANLHRDVPSGEEGFSVRPSAPKSELRRLMATIETEGTSKVVAQVAVWAVTDNPSRATLDRIYRRTSSFGGPFGDRGSPAADDDDVKAAGELLRKAGINPSSRRLFR